MYESGNSNLYAYQYDWDDHRRYVVADFKKLFGAAHATEIPLLAGNAKLVGGYPLSDLIYPAGRSRLFTSRNMMRFWTNFAKNGEPGKSSNDIIWVKYNPMTDKSILHIDEKKDFRIDNLDLSMQELVSGILSSQIIDTEEKCILLYETTNYIGDDSFEKYVKDLNFKCSRDEALRISKQNSETIVF